MRTYTASRLPRGCVILYGSTKSKVNTTQRCTHSIMCWRTLEQTVLHAHWYVRHTKHVSSEEEPHQIPESTTSQDWYIQRSSTRDIQCYRHSKNIQLIHDTIRSKTSSKRTYMDPYIALYLLLFSPYWDTVSFAVMADNDIFTDIHVHVHLYAG